MRAQRRSPEGAPPTATLPSVDPDYGTALPGDMKTRLTRLDWRGIQRALWQWGYAKTPPLLRPSEFAQPIGLYADERRVPSTIDMARYQLGVGENRHLAPPPPPLGQTLRRHPHP